jgi:hypothetical protein
LFDLCRRHGRTCSGHLDWIGGERYRGAPAAGLLFQVFPVKEFIPAPICAYFAGVSTLCAADIADKCSMNWEIKIRSQNLRI